MSAQEALINRVVDYLDSLRRNVEKLLDFIASEIGHGKNSCRPGQHSLGRLKIKRAPESALLTRTRHVLEHVVDRHHIGTRQRPRQGKKIGDMRQVAIQSLHRIAELTIASKGTLSAKQWNRLEVWRQSANFINLGRRPDQKILVLVVEPAQRANHITDIGAHAKLGHPPYVDGDSHRWHLTIVGALRLGSAQAKSRTEIMPSLQPGLSRGARHREEMLRTGRAPACEPC